MDKIKTNNSTGIALCIFGFFATLIIYLYKIKFFPITGGDESSLLNIPYRASTFGDLKYPVFAPQYTYDAGFWRAFPPINAQMLRIIYHFFVDCTVELSRILSAVLTLCSTLIAMTLFKIIFPKISPFKLAIAFIAIGLTPAMILNARSVRFEQEILFWGVLATLGLFILLTKIKSKRWAWFFSGIFAGLAGTMHPFGIVFPIIIFSTFLLNSKEWRSLDSLTNKQRIMSWLVGCFIPVTVTLIDLGYKFKGFLEYYPAGTQFYKVRTQQFITMFANSYTGFFSNFVPLRLKAFFYQVNHYSLAAENIPIFGQLHPWYSLITWLSIIIAFILLASSFRKETSRKPLPFPLTMSNYLIFGFLGMTLYFPPNQTYYIYLAFFITVQLCLVYFYADQYKIINTLPGKLLLILSGGSLCSLFVLNLLSSFYLVDHLTHQNKYNAVGQDYIFETEKKFSTELGIFDGTEGTTLIDSYTWPFSGKNAGGWNSAVGGSLPENIAGAAFHTDVLDFLINYLPTMTKIPLSETQKRQYADQVLQHLKLTRILVVSPNPTNFYFYTKSTLGDDQIKLTVINNDISSSVFASDQLLSAMKTNQNNAEPQLSWDITQRGYYLLITASEVKGFKRDEIKFYQNETQVLPIHQSKKTKEAVNFYLFSLAPGEFHAANIADNQVISFKHMVRERVS